MATTPTQEVHGFSIANFKKLFNSSNAKQYMSDMDIEQIRAAVEEKDVVLLGTLYEILLKEQASNDEIVRDFIMTKNKILDGFMIESRNIEKKFVQAPRQAAVAQVERKEQKSAEDILKNL